MKPINIRNEQTNNNSNPENNASNSAWNSASRLQNLAGKIEEAKWTDAQTPNPKKAPLNYIDNMWEWEDAQKKYTEEVTKKQQELTTILSAYEDKTEETDRFRVAKSELEIKLGKVMWIIIDKLKEDEISLTKIFLKIWTSDIDDNGEINDTESNEEEDSTENWDEDKEEVTEEDVESEDEEQGNENWNEDNTSEDFWENEKAKEILNILKSSWFNVNSVQLIPIDKFKQGLWWVNLNEYTDLDEELEAKLMKDSWYWESVDEAKELIDAFIRVVKPEYWNNFKKHLSKEEIEYIEKLHAQVKKQCKSYSELSRQIKLIDNKVTELEFEEAKIYSEYYKWVMDAKKLSEDFEKTNEKYFLNSYLSTRNASLDKFVSNPLVEKQISNIIELNKQGKPIPKTILLYWNINSWKSYAANVLATELWRKMYQIKSYDIFTWWFSDPNAMLDAIFTWAIKKKEPCIIFLDEIESYTQWYDWSPYQNLLENTIRHHISKIKESNLDIIVIWAISDKSKVCPELFKQDVFSKQIFFTWLDKEKSEILFNKIIEEKGLKLWKDVNIHKIFEKNLKNININPEYMKKIIAFTIDFHKLNEISDSDDITLHQKDFDAAINFIDKHINASKVWYYLSMIPK